jgi:hypothetical protein
MFQEEPPHLRRRELGGGLFMTTLARLGADVAFRERGLGWGGWALGWGGRALARHRGGEGKKEGGDQQQSGACEKAHYTDPRPPHALLPRPRRALSWGLPVSLAAPRFTRGVLANAIGFLAHRMRPKILDAGP